MIDGLNILAVIPARGGSKGVPLKNLRKVGGVELVKRAAQLATSIDLIDKVVVSTDNNKIAQCAIDGGAVAPFVRPIELSGDRISDVQVLSHALIEMEILDNCVYDIILMLQPTSPLRNEQHIISVLNLLINDKWDAVWTVSETDSKHHPLKQLVLNNGELDYYDQAGSRIVARQQLRTIYHRNGIAYGITKKCLIEKGSIKGNKTGVVICKGNHISIDTEFDIEMAEYFFKKTFNRL